MKKLDIIFYSSFLFISIMSLIFNSNLIIIDYKINEVFLYKDEFLIFLMEIFSFFGSALFLIIISLISLIFYKNKKVTLNLSFVFILNIILKNIVARERPPLSIIEENGFSFPSGHAMVSIAFYGLFIYFIINSNMHKYTKIFLVFLLTSLILLISFSRIYLGVHYFTDIIFGLLFGILYLKLFIKIF